MTTSPSRTAPPAPPARLAQQIADGYCLFLKIVIALCLAGMCVLVFGNVVLRYAFNSGITASEEISRLLFVWLTFLGAVVVLREHGHLGVDMLVRALPDAGRRACLVLSHLLMLYVTWLLLQGSWDQTLINLGVTSPATGYSMALFYGAGVAFAVPAGLILLNGLYGAVTGRLRGADLIMVQESEEHVDIDSLRGHPAFPDADRPTAPLATTKR
ncbi:TRAP transporter small permease [Arenibaculum pallidiluteum]|uniref:TRAP transporter small permease n=1 Tax=Arenibaculum pallidiluteum TaxID=2812559 RepID=UPI001A970F4B|nr:TRAP transporter small permease [Arenibaculum pallidiluteum]